MKRFFLPSLVLVSVALFACASGSAGGIDDEEVAGAGGEEGDSGASGSAAKGGTSAAGAAGKGGSGASGKGGSAAEGGTGGSGASGKGGSSGTGGTGGAGASGASGKGGSSGAGGSAGTGGAGASGASGKGGASGSGGTAGAGGASGKGGSSGTGGSSAGSGGASGTGGSAGSGGASGTGGTAGTGGSAGTGGASGTGGSAGTGGSGGASGTGGAAGTGGSAGTGGAAGSGGSTTGDACATALAGMLMDFEGVDNAGSSSGLLVGGLDGYSQNDTDWPYVQFFYGQAAGSGKTSGPSDCAGGSWCAANSFKSDYAQCGRTRATIPARDLSVCAGRQVKFVFDHWYDFSVIQDGSTYYDGGFVEFSTGGPSATAWTKADGQYDGTIRINGDLGTFQCKDPTGFYVNNEVGYVGNSGGVWTHAEFAIPTKFLVKTFSARFVWSSGVSYKTDKAAESRLHSSAGWYIDNIGFTVAP